MKERVNKINSIFIIGVVVVATIVFACLFCGAIPLKNNVEILSTVADPIVNDAVLKLPIGGISGKINEQITDYDLSSIKLLDSLDETIEYVIDSIVVSSLPSGLSYDDLNKLIGGTPTESFNGNIQVAVTGEGHEVTGEIACYIENTVIDASQVVLENNVFDYNGADLMPTITVNNDINELLIENTHYTLAYTRNGSVTTDFISVGTIGVQVDMIAPYSGSFALSYQIKYFGKDDLTFTDMQKPVVANYDIRFDEVVIDGLKVWKNDVRQNIESITLMNPEDLPLGVVYSSNALRGRAMEVVATRTLKFLLKTTANDYREFTLPITVKRQTLLSNNITLEYLTTYYNAVDRKPNIQVKDNDGRLLIANVDYVVTYKRNGNITTDFMNITGNGGVSVEIDGQGNYQGKHIRNYTILPKVMDESYVKDIPDAEYIGNDLYPTVFFNNYGSNEHDIFIYREDRVCQDFVNAGIIRIEVVFKGNYSGKIIKYYRILPVVADSADVNVSSDVIYDGTVKQPTVTVTKWLEGRDYTIKYYRNEIITTDFTSAGRIDIVITFINNTSGEYIFRYNISPKNIIDIQLNVSGNVVYTGKDVLPSIYVNNIYQRHVDYDIIYLRNGKVTDDIKNVGVITVKALMKGNYLGEQSGEYSILYSMLNVTGQDNLSAKISSSTGFQLNTTFTITLLDNPTISLRLNAGEEIKMAVNVKMILGVTESDLDNKATLRLKPNFEASGVENIRIEYLDKGEQTSRRVVVDSSGYLTFDIYSVGEIVIIAKVGDEITLPWWTWLAVAGGGFVLLMIVILIIYLSFRNNGIRTIMPKKRR